MSHKTDHESCAACTARWRLPLLLAIVLAGMLLFFESRARVREHEAPQPNPATAEESIAPSAERVQLSIDFGNDRPAVHKTASWREGMTVADLMHGENPLQVRTEGDGASAFLIEINGLANEGAGGRNWLYRVNGKHADRSFAVYELQPGDDVLWTFTKQQ